jgi:hypothetical protein
MKRKHSGIRRHIEVLAKEFRSMALVAGQFSVEGNMTPDHLRAAGEAETFAVCAEKLEALLRADTEGDRQAPAVMAHADIDQIIEGIEHFIITGDPEVQGIWQPYIDKLRALKP